MLEKIRYFNINYAQTVDVIFNVFIIGIIGNLWKTYKEAKVNPANKEIGDAASIVPPRWVRTWRKPIILAVHEFEKDDKDPSGYRHLGQNSRPDQYERLIDLRRTLLWNEIVPKDPRKILRVIISRNGKEKWKSVHFNN